MRSPGSSRAIRYGLFVALIFSSAQLIAAQTTTTWSWCMSDTMQSVVYVSQPIDSGMNRRVSFNGSSLGRQYGEYIHGRFDIRGNATCSTKMGSDQAGVTQLELAAIADLRRQNKQVLALTDWHYIRDDVAINASFDPKSDPTYTDVEDRRPNDHLYCVSDSFQNTVYYAEPIRFTNPDTNTPSVAFFNMLQQKYGFKGQQTCSILTQTRAELFLSARLAGAKAGGKRIVNAGWPAAAPVTSLQTRQDDDREPAQKPATNQQPVSEQVSNIATKEVNSALQFCQKTRALLVAYDCSCLQIKIYNYRIAHPADTLKGTPALASFFDGKLFECEKCLTDARAKMEARNRAVSAGLRLSAQQDCVADKFVVLIHANPVPSLAQSQLDSAIKACR